MITTLAGDAPKVLAAITSARADARARAWTLAGTNAPDHGIGAEAPLIIDLDATLTDAHSEKQNAAPTFKRGFGFHSLWSFIDHGPAGTGEPAAPMLRPGNAGSNTAADHKQVLHDALAQLPWQPLWRAGRKVLVRTDSGGGTHEFLDYCHRRRLQSRSDSPSPTTSSPPWTPTLSRVTGPRPTTPTARSATAPGSPRPPASPICPVGRRTCVWSSEKNAHIPARSCGSPTTTGCG